MSNGFIYVVDAHFIDKIEEKKSWAQVPVQMTCFCDNSDTLIVAQLTNNNNIHVHVVNNEVL